MRVARQAATNPGLQVDWCQFRSIGRLELHMSTEPNTNSADGNRENMASREEALIKQLKAVIDSQGICGKAFDLLHKRIASGELTDNMLLRIVLSLAKSTAYFTMDGRPQAKRRGLASRSGYQSSRVPTHRTHRR
jgi:hypothetical protein